MSAWATGGDDTSFGRDKDGSLHSGLGNDTMYGGSDSDKIPPGARISCRTQEV
jgi:Ca2+-binding RTX toxin-like protein